VFTSFLVDALILLLHGYACSEVLTQASRPPIESIHQSASSCSIQTGHVSNIRNSVCLAEQLLSTICKIRIQSCNHALSNSRVMTYSDYENGAIVCSSTMFSNLLYDQTKAIVYVLAQKIFHPTIKPDDCAVRLGRPATLLRLREPRLFSILGRVPKLGQTFEARAVRTRHSAHLAFRSSSSGGCKIGRKSSKDSVAEQEHQIPGEREGPMDKLRASI